MLELEKLPGGVQRQTAGHGHQDAQDLPSIAYLTSPPLRIKFSSDTAHDVRSMVKAQASLASLAAPHLCRTRRCARGAVSRLRIPHIAPALGLPSRPAGGRPRPPPPRLEQALLQRGLGGARQERHIPPAAARRRGGAEPRLMRLRLQPLHRGLPQHALCCRLPTLTLTLPVSLPSRAPAPPAAPPRPAAARRRRSPRAPAGSLRPSPPPCSCACKARHAHARFGREGGLQLCAAVLPIASAPGTCPRRGLSPVVPASATYTSRCTSMRAGARRACSSAAPSSWRCRRARTKPSTRGRSLGERVKGSASYAHSKNSSGSCGSMRIPWVNMGTRYKTAHDVSESASSTGDSARTSLAWLQKITNLQHLRTLPRES